MKTLSKKMARLCASILARPTLSLAIKIPVVALIAIITTVLELVHDAVLCCVLPPLLILRSVLLLLSPWRSYANRPRKLGIVPALIVCWLA